MAILLLLTAGALAPGCGGDKGKPEAGRDVDKMLAESADLTEANKLAQAENLLQQVLKGDPQNPLALNNLAAVMVKEKKYDRAEAYLKEALPRSKGYLVTTKLVCPVGEICMSFKPKGKEGGNQELEPLINLNLLMIRQLRAAGEAPGGGAK